MERKENIFYAIEFDGEYGGDKIQRAIETALKEKGDDEKIIVVSSEGPDNGRWILKNSIKLPSNTTLLLKDCYIFLKDNAKDNLITNQDHKNGNENINIIGIGNPVLDGNGSNQGRKGRFDRHSYMFGIYFNKVKNISIKNIKIGPTTAYGISIEDVENAEISDIYLNQDGKQPNQDGVNVSGPAKNIVIKNIYGNSGDDSVAIGALLKVKDEENIWRTFFHEGEGGDIENVTIQNVRTRVLESGNNIRLLCGDGRKLRNVRINGVYSLPESKADSLIVFGNAKTYTKKFPKSEDFTDIYISCIHAFKKNKKSLIWIDSPVGNLHFSEISINWEWKDVFLIEEGNHVENLNITNLTVFGKGENVFKIDGTVENFIISETTVEGSEHFFSGNGKVKNIFFKGVLIKNF